MDFSWGQKVAALGGRKAPQRGRKASHWGGGQEEELEGQLPSHHALALELGLALALRGGAGGAAAFPCLPLLCWPLSVGNLRLYATLQKSSHWGPFQFFFIPDFI